MLEIKLLGKPRLEGMGAQQMRGRKSWALLAYLSLEGTVPSRSHLAETLFPDADDPIRALRWNLTEIRRALGSSSVGSGDRVHLQLPQDCRVDALDVVSAPWWVASAVHTLDQPLLDGFDNLGSPGFETWLVSKRRYLQHSAISSLREAVLAHLGEDRPERAIADAVRLVALDPYSEEDQALLIRCYSVAGDPEAAARQLASCRRLLRVELGVEPGPILLAASQLHPRPAKVLGRADIEAKLEAGDAAFEAGAIDTGLERLREAAAGGKNLGDDELSMRVCLALGSALAHAGRRHHPEGAAALHRSLDLAARIDRPQAAAEAMTELGWIEFMAARYGRAHHWLNDALATSTDPRIQTRALWIRGKCWLEMGYYKASLDDLKAAAGSSEQSEDRARRIFCLSSLGRTQMLMGAREEAAASLTAALRIGEDEGFTWSTSLPGAFLAEVYIFWNMHDDAERLLDSSLAVAREVGDPSFETFACRGWGVLAASKKDLNGSLAWLKRGYSRWTSEPDCEWALAFTLDALADVTSDWGLPEADRWITELESLASSTGMRELVSHCYLYRHRCGDSMALEKARALAQSIDNPELHRLLDLADSTSRSGRIPTAF